VEIEQAVTGRTVTSSRAPRLANWARILMATAFSAAGLLAGTIAGPSQLQVNLGPMPFDGYLSGGVNPYMPVYGSNPQTYGGACPSGTTTVRACYQAILRDFYNNGVGGQGVSGVRIQFGVCGGGYSTPLQGCGSVWTSVSGPVLGTGGLSNVCNGTGGGGSKACARSLQICTHTGLKM
jgi:hypothetical protein